MYGRSLSGSILSTTCFLAAKSIIHLLVVFKSAPHVSRAERDSTHVICEQRGEAKALPPKAKGREKVDTPVGAVSQ